MIQRCFSVPELHQECV